MVKLEAILRRMNDAEIQDLCERGQRELMETDYLAAVDTFVAAEQAAWDLKAFDTLSRLYLPLQEARRQVRQRCGEGAVRLRPTADPKREINPVELLATVPHGQLLVAGQGSIAPAISVRQLAHERHLYLETFLGAVYDIGEAKRAVVVAPLPESQLPSNSKTQTLDQLRDALPASSLLMSIDDLPPDLSRGTADSYAIVMALWEKLHRPFLAAADRETDPIKKMEACRLTLRVDPACELAHQKLADVARMLARN